MDSKCIAFKFQMLTWHIYLDLTISNLIGLKCTCDLCLQTYFIHSLPLLHNGKTLNTPNKATIFITHNLPTDFSKILLPLFYEYIQNLALHSLYFLYFRDSQFVTGAIFTFKTLCGDMQVIQRWVKHNSRHQGYCYQIEMLKYVL